MPSDTVVITGFGPFATYKVNASWEAAKLLPGQQINVKHVVVKQLPVVYQHIDEEIPNLWRLHDPKLVVHVGVSHLADKLTLESRAFRYGYLKQDCENNLHPTGEICLAEDGADCIAASLDIDNICAVLNTGEIFKACQSEDAGRFICEYTFYKSLSINERRTLFVHVPILDKPYSAEQLACALAHIVNCALKQLEDDDNNHQISVEEKQSN